MPHFPFFFNGELYLISINRSFIAKTSSFFYSYKTMSFQRTYPSKIFAQVFGLFWRIFGSKLLLVLFLLGIAISIGRSLPSVRGKDCFSLALLAKAKGEKETAISPNLSQLLDQPFHYIGHGTQAVAFVSKDGQYILKCFLMKTFEGKKKFKIKSPLRLIRSYREKREREKMERHVRNLQNVVNRYKKAFERLKEETALLATHFYQTEDLPICTLYDRYGKEWQADLNTLCFVVQRKVFPLADRWNQCIDSSEKKKLLHTIEMFLEKRARKGFFDFRENFFIANYGFLEENLILLDAGKIVYSEEIEKNPESEIEEMKGKLKRAFSL